MAALLRSSGYGLKEEFMVMTWLVSLWPPVSIPDAAVFLR